MSSPYEEDEWYDDVDVCDNCGSELQVDGWCRWCDYGNNDGYDAWDDDDGDIMIECMECGTHAYLWEAIDGLCPLCYDAAHPELQDGPYDNGTSPVDDADPDPKSTAPAQPLIPPSPTEDKPL